MIIDSIIRERSEILLIVLEQRTRGGGGISRIKLYSSWRKDWNIFLHRSAFDRTVFLSEFHINVLMEIEGDDTESMEVLQLKLGQPTRVTDVLGS